MAFFDGIPCPVCGKPFVSEDDVVVCPVCGTPHHRSCWKQDNHCVNETKHEEGFQYERPAAVKLEEGAQETATPSAPVSTQAQTREIPCPGCGHAYDGSYSFCPQCGLRRQQAAGAPVPPAAPRQFMFPSVPPMFANQENVKIGGESVTDLAQAIGPNAQRYIPVFLRQEQTKRKVGWNWCSFFFGGYWLFSRKCYPLGFVAVLLQLAVAIPFNVILSKLPAYETFMSGMQSYQGALSEPVITAFQQLLPYMLGMFTLSLALRVIWGLFGDYIYKKRALQVVKEERAAYETTKLTSPVAITYGNIQLNPHDVYYAMLARRGGINIFAAMGSFLLYGMAENALLMLFLS